MEVVLTAAEPIQVQPGMEATCHAESAVTPERRAASHAPGAPIHLRLGSGGFVPFDAEGLEPRLAFFDEGVVDAMGGEQRRVLFGLRNQNAQLVEHAASPGAPVVPKAKNRGT